MQLPENNKLSINILSAVFNDTTNSYKFYWFLAILDEITETNGNKLNIDNLSIRMLSDVWYPLDYFKLSFGKQDSFKNIAKYLTEKISIDNNPNSENLFNQITKKLNDKDLQSLKKQIRDLIKYVPYRFIRPFFENDLKGEKDVLVNGKIIELAKNNFETIKPFYYFSDNYIIIQNDWFDYFIKHKYILQSFVYWHLINYLQKNNPNVIGLSEKLFKPKQRDLKIANSFWKNYLHIKNSVNCIYSNILLKDKFSIDHFVPWSYIAHDQLWNLIPTSVSVNSAKSDNLPNYEKYFVGFSQLQFDAFKTIYKSEIKDKSKLLEDYSVFFKTDLQIINEFSVNQFQYKLEETIKPMLQFAENLGFNSNWIYK